MFKGELSDLQYIPIERHDELRRRASYLQMIFERNAENCKKVGISINKQRVELLAYYGIKISANSMSAYRTGKRYRVGFALVMAIRDYWAERGIPFSLD